MKGLEVSILNYKNLRDLILGSEFNSNKKLNALKELKSNKVVLDYFDMKSDISNIKNNTLSYDLTHTLGNFLHDISITPFIEGQRKKANVGDFIISRLRSYLREFAVVVNREFEQVFSSEYLVYRPKTNLISANTLLAYCLTNQVQLILDCSQYGTAHPRFYEFIFNELPIPKTLININKSIDLLFKKAFELRYESKKAYSYAETIFLNDFGLQDFEPSKDCVNIKNFKESFGITKRLDAEFYQKKYDDLEKIIFQVPHKKIKDIRSVNFRGVQPIYYQDGGLNIINSKHILDTELDYDNFEKTNIEYWNKNERARVFKGDILTYTTGANIGRTQTYLKEEKALASNHVNIIRLNKENPYYVGFVLNSIVGRLQTEKRSAGSAQAELYPKDLDEFLIPLIDTKKQNQIVELLEESFKYKRESENLLQVAKKAVEMAIDGNEKMALEFINNNLNHNGK